MLKSLLLAALAALLAAPASAVTIDWVAVGDPGNAADTPSTNCFASSCGSVGYSYMISKYEVTNSQYVELLNAKAAADPFGLYNTNMDSAVEGGITRSGVAGSYTYAVKPGFADKPVTSVSFYDSIRFANWLNNGQAGADTETGSYTITPAGLTANSITRNANANIVLPSENEWYKAAYYDGVSATYFDYPTGTDTTTGCAAPTASANSASCNYAASNVTDVGAYTGSASPYGTFDQGGNVWEWNEEIVFAIRGLRGGSWGDAAIQLAASSASAYNPSAEYNYIGFRVASVVPEPGTMLLMMTGLAGLSWKQRRLAKAL